MDREQVREMVRKARTLETCEAAEQVLADYLKEHLDDFDVVMEGESIHMMKTALQEVATASQPVSASR